MRFVLKNTTVTIPDEVYSIIVSFLITPQPQHLLHDIKSYIHTHDVAYDKMLYIYRGKFEVDFVYKMMEDVLVAFIQHSGPDFMIFKRLFTCKNSSKFSSFRIYYHYGKFLECSTSAEIFKVLCGLLTPDERNNFILTLEDL